ncbi:MAG: methyltransferase domain-containing protein [Pseudomonadota bacterium]
MTDAPTPRDPAPSRPEFSGVCSICGWTGVFDDCHRSPRESYRCGRCQASFRYRHQADALLHQYSRRGSASLAELVKEPGFADLHVYEAGLIGPFRRYFQALPHYVQSYFWDDIPRGGDKDGVRSEDLEDMTFEDETFDLMITSDILEHVRHPLRAFAESFRILKRGGKHIFSIPVPWPWLEETRKRVDVSGPEDVFLLEPRYHGSPVDPQGSLVYNDFGVDLVGQLEDIGFEVRVPRSHGPNLTFITIRP